MAVGALRYVLDMGKTRVPTDGLAGKLIDELRLQEVELGKAQARRAELMVEFLGARQELDRERIADCNVVGSDARFKAGEFAALEISLAVKTSKYLAQRILAMTRRVQAECPDAWDAWHAGQIDHDKVVRINRALRRLVHDSSKQLLNSLVVDVAIGQTPELLGRWLNQFIARVEPDEQDERLRRSMEDRYASVRPDIDGMSFLSALMSAVDAAAIDRILAALAAAAPPGDTRTMAQRRSDALVDMLCGRISNGCHVRWDTNDDRDDNLDDPAGDGDDVTPSAGSEGHGSNGLGVADGDSEGHRGDVETSLVAGVESKLARGDGSGHNEAGEPCLDDEGPQEEWAERDGTCRRRHSGPTRTPNQEIAKKRRRHRTIRPTKRRPMEGRVSGPPKPQMRDLGPRKEPGGSPRARATTNRIRCRCRSVLWSRSSPSSGIPIPQVN